MACMSGFRLAKTSKATEAAEVKSSLATGQDFAKIVAELQSLVYDFYNDLDDLEKSQYADRIGNCLDASILWPEALKDKGFKFYLEQTVSVSKLKVSGENIDTERADQFLSKNHFFLTAEKNGQRIILDPSYLQFFEEIPTELEDKIIFVGKLEDLKKLYEKNADHLRLDVEGDTNTGKYDPGQLFDFIYSTAEYERFRTSIPIPG